MCNVPRRSQTQTWPVGRNPSSRQLCGAPTCLVFDFQKKSARVHFEVHFYLRLFENLAKLRFGWSSGNYWLCARDAEKGRFVTSLCFEHKGLSTQAANCPRTLVARASPIVRPEQISTFGTRRTFQSRQIAARKPSFGAVNLTHCPSDVVAFVCALLSVSAYCYHIAALGEQHVCPHPLALEVEHAQRLVRKLGP